MGEAIKSPNHFYRGYSKFFHENNYTPDTVIDFFLVGAGGDGKKIASFRVVCLGFSGPFSLCFLCCFVLEQRTV